MEKLNYFPFAFEGEGCLSGDVDDEVGETGMVRGDSGGRCVGSEIGWWGIMYCFTLIPKLILVVTDYGLMDY